MDVSMKDLADLFGVQKNANAHPFAVGDSVFIRTVTYHVTGKVEKVCDLGLVLSTAAWIADSGDFSASLKSCNFNEVEPFNTKVFVTFSSMTDATWIDKLPTERK